jgi:hypothetical protein
VSVVEAVDEPVDEPVDVGVRRRLRRRPAWWTQVLVIGFFLWAYDAINNLSSVRRGTALAHGAAIFHVERRLHLDPELTLNHWLAQHLTFGRLLADYYDNLHFVVTLGVLFWVWWRHSSRYRMLRNTLIGTNLIGFAVFWLYPVAPPRMLAAAGFVDIVSVTHAIGAWSTGAFASQANEYAAMPSLHVAWAIWCALAVWVVRRDALSRIIAAVYVVVTTLIVMATANHYLLDVAAGALTAGVSVTFALIWERRRRADRVVATP